MARSGCGARSAGQPSEATAPVAPPSPMRRRPTARRVMRTSPPTTSSWPMSAGESYLGTTKVLVRTPRKWPAAPRVRWPFKYDRLRILEPLSGARRACTRGPQTTSTSPPRRWRRAASADVMRLGLGVAKCPEGHFPCWVCGECVQWQTGQRFHMPPNSSYPRGVRGYLCPFHADYIFLDR